MRYAIISDIHGNMDALAAVLSDIKNNPVDRYIFVGDYCSYFPYPNEVVDAIKSLGNAALVRGNEDSALFAYAAQDQSAWTNGQFQAHYWCYREISRTNHAYLASLPETLTLEDSGAKIMIAHKSSHFIGDLEHKEFSSLRVSQRYEKPGGYSRHELLDDISEYMQRGDAASVIHALPDGIYIFGHTHVQWHARLSGKVFINPGSCGLPCDAVSGAAYTLLEVEKDKIDITERRVAYDINSLAKRYQTSGLYEAAPVWSQLILHELQTALECALPFLQFTNEYATKIGDPVRPYTIETWTGAFSAWKHRNLKRCPWCGDIPIYVRYHDEEWGRPVHDDIRLFEMLILEGMQAGLSWITVLKKREAFREAFDGFDPNKVALYGDEKIRELLANERIIRNRLKLSAAVTNAKAFLMIQNEYGSFDRFIWGYMDNAPITGHWNKMEDVPARTPLSDRISKDLIRRGFKFVGSTIIYSFMQATGMVNDHITECFAYER